MSIPVEQIGADRQRIPGVLVKIEKSLAFVKYAPKLAPVKVPLSELQLAPSAFESCDDVFAHTERTSEVCTKNATQSYSPREPAEIWLNTEVTTRKKIENEDSGKNTQTQEASATYEFQGAWWPGRVLTTQGGFAHVEVAAPLVESNTIDDVSVSHVVPHIIRMGPALPYRSTLVRLDEIRSPWLGQVAHTHQTNGYAHQGINKENTQEPALLTTPGVLHRHTVCIPAYLARLAASPDSHSALFKFCDAPCLVQCDPEPFLSNQLAKLILADSDSSAVSGRQTPNAGIDSDPPIPVTVPADPRSSSWPSTLQIARSAALGAPTIAGTLSSAGVTDPALLLEGLPGANGPLVLLHIWSGSSEAIRRAALLELAHVRILVFRYHVLRKLSSGEPGEIDLTDSTDAPTENGDAPVMHCKPISIPIQVNNEGSIVDSRSPGTMIGYSAQFIIPSQLIGLAIGYRGATIQEARALPGVRTVDLLHDGIVYVEAETVDACQAVRNLLDFTEAEIPVSPRLASRLIGSKGINIRKLAASAGVRRAQLLNPLMRKRRMEQQKQNQLPVPHPARDHSEANSTSRSSSPETDKAPDTGDLNKTDSESHEGEPLPSPAFYLLGTRPAVAKMRLLLEFQADNWNELDELEEARRSLFSQLRQSNQSVTKNHFVPPPGNPSDVPHRDGPISMRGRGRRTSGRGGSVDHTPDQDQSSNQFQNHQRGHAMSNGVSAIGRGNRPTRYQDNGLRDGIEVEVLDGSPKQSSNDATSQQLPPPNNVKPTRGRGRGRPRGRPIQAS